jgi:hypothetical protein
LKETGPRQLNIAFADSPLGGGRPSPRTNPSGGAFCCNKREARRREAPATCVAQPPQVSDQLALEF